MESVINSIAKVSILDCPYCIDKEFDYLIPEGLKNAVVPGVFVLVPFGGANSRRIGLVHSLAQQTSTYRIKPIIEVIESMWPLCDESIRLCEFVRERCFCSTGTALKAVMPQSVMPNAQFKYIAVKNEHSDSILQKLNDAAKVVYSFILLNKDVTDAKLIAEYGEDAIDVVKALIKLQLAEKVSYVGSTKDKLEKYIRLPSLNSEDEERLSGGSYGNSPKQQQLAELLLEYGELSQSEILDRLSVTASVINSMEKKGLVISEKRAVVRSPFEELYEEDINKSEVSLSSAQQSAYGELEAIYEKGTAGCALLHGITGSGKTMVMKKLIDRVIADKKTVIMLLPEIALTPQAVRIFIGYYGRRVAVFHSGLSIGERHDAWRSVQNGEIDLIIGTRSAVFAPIKDLGLIIIDEEQESSYKSDISPKYHARDIARFRCAYNGCMLLLASATPSVESYYKAKNGIYSLVKLKERYGNAVLPDTMISDMRYCAVEGSEMIGKHLQSELALRLQNKEKSVLFLNRRGYRVFMSCRNCGETVMCPRCSVSLTLHRTKGNGGNIHRLVCHYCGYSVSPPKLCPSCQSEALKYFGLGTQKIEDELEDLFPHSEIVRMDADTTVGKMAHKKIIDKFSDEGADMLVGTQMVTKGHDFKNVTLVGILSADMSLHSDDFRAGERTFSLITQCAGRAGRSGKKGLAIIQTYTPNHPVIKFAASQDYESFYKNEIAIRKEMVFPPFCDFAVFSLSGPFEKDLMQTAQQLRAAIEKTKGDCFPSAALIVFGPFEAGVYKINNSYRLKIVIKCKNNKMTRDLFSQVLKEFTKKLPKGINIGIDLNPSNV